jgi:DNA-directed RNA polymerase subunit E'
MDGRIDIDLDNQRLIGKDTKKDLKAGDKVRVKIVNLNLNSSNVRDSRIGFTMKQMGLGKLQWLYKKKVEN